MVQPFLNQTTLASLVGAGARLPSYPRGTCRIQNCCNCKLHRCL